MKLLSSLASLVGLFAATVAASNEEMLEATLLNLLKRDTDTINQGIKQRIPKVLKFESGIALHVNKTKFGVDYGYDASLDQINHVNSLEVKFNSVDLRSTETSLTVNIDVSAAFSKDLKIVGAAKAYFGVLSIGGDAELFLNDLSLGTTVGVTLYMKDPETLSVKVNVEDFRLTNLDVDDVYVDWVVASWDLPDFVDDMINGVANTILEAVEEFRPELEDKILKSVNEKVAIAVSSANLSAKLFAMAFSKAHAFLLQRLVLLL